MFNMTVTKIGGNAFAKVAASHRQALLDHLEASAKRNGFEVTWNEPGVHGDIVRDGQIVGQWEVSAA